MAQHKALKMFRSLMPVGKDPQEWSRELDQAVADELDELAESLPGLNTMHLTRVKQEFKGLPDRMILAGIDLSKHWERGTKASSAGGRIAVVNRVQAVVL